MKHIFVINPNSGKGHAYDIVMPKLNAALEGRELDHVIYVSKSSEDTSDYCKKWAASGEKIRIYACGGDGTIYDVVNAVYGFDNVEFAAIPLGSGNDFVRMFGTKEQFTDIGAQIDGTPIKIDAIRCGDRIAVNQCSMGFDAEVCVKQADFKKIPWLTGESSYMASVLYCLWNKRKNKFKVIIDDGEELDGEFLFSVCTNGRYYGGGFMAGPYAVPDDGLLDFCIIRTMSIPKFLPKISQYKKGKQCDWVETKYLRGKKLTIKSEILAAVNIDGETDMEKEVTFEVIPSAFNFVIPSTSSYIEDRKNGVVSDKIGG